MVFAVPAISNRLVIVLWRSQSAGPRCRASCRSAGGQYQRAARQGRGAAAGLRAAVGKLNAAGGAVDGARHGFSLLTSVDF